MCHGNTKALAMAEGHVWVSGSVAMSELISRVHVTTEDCSEALGLVSHLRPCWFQESCCFKSYGDIGVWGCQGPSMFATLVQVQLGSLLMSMVHFTKSFTETMCVETLGPCWISPTLQWSWGCYPCPSLNTAAVELAPMLREMPPALITGLGVLTLITWLWESWPAPHLGAAVSEAWAYQLSYHPGTHPGPWLGPAYHLPHLWPAVVCEGTGLIEH